MSTLILISGGVYNVVHVVSNDPSSINHRYTPRAVLALLHHVMGRMNSTHGLSPLLSPSPPASPSTPPPLALWT